MMRLLDDVEVGCVAGGNDALDAAMMDCRITAIREGAIQGATMFGNGYMGALTVIGAVMGAAGGFIKGWTQCRVVSE